MSIHRMVQTVRQDKEVSLEYMKILERERMIREEGKKDGREIFSLLDEDPDAADLEIARKTLGFPESDKEAWKKDCRTVAR